MIVKVVCFVVIVLVVFLIVLVFVSCVNVNFSVVEVCIGELVLYGEVYGFVLVFKGIFYVVFLEG